MSYAKSAVAKNTLIQTAGKGLSTLLGLITFAILWRILGPTDYGTLTIALTFLAVFATFVDFGLTLTTVQLISEHADREKEILNNLLSLRLISAGIFLGAAPIISLFFPYTTTVQILVAIGVISYYSSSISQMLVGIFQKNLDMRKPMIAENLNRLLVLIGIAAIGLLGGSLVAIMWVFVAGNITQLAAVLWYTKRYATLKPQISWEIWKLIIGRSWPIGISIFFNINFCICTLKVLL
jgi:O-antigen/teichoic acid export membrane protein